MNNTTANKIKINDFIQSEQGKKSISIAIDSTKETIKKLNDARKIDPKMLLIPMDI
jgi:hypothetical protein